MSEQEVSQIIELILVADLAAYAVLIGFVCGLVMSCFRWLQDRGSAAAHIRYLEDENFSLKNQINVLVDERIQVVAKDSHSLST